MKVGDYVRYKRPFDRKETIMIGKILSIYEPDEKHKIKGYDLDTSDVISDEFSIKSSPNIIDLIEVGDIIKKTYKTGLIEKIPINKIEDIEHIKLDLKNGFKPTIVTKEQFSQMEYRIGE